MASNSTTGINCAPTESEIMRVHDFIALREKDLQYLTQEHQKEEERLRVAEKAITNLTSYALHSTVDTLIPAPV
ncbi:hypothetical protein CPB86DRAFT_789831 [Serendipita vermifera]|nr:hypothetical protein CPB86DRAFT_789831 [Serendipita vermifera]